MNRTEAAQVLAILAAPHNRDVSHDTAEVWYRTALERIDLDTALEVAVRLVETEERFPTPARFNAERSAMARMERQYNEYHRQLPPAPVDPTTAARLVAEARKIVDANKVGKHWHGGPNPCEVCGGMAPKAAS